MIRLLVLAILVASGGAASAQTTGLVRPAAVLPSDKNEVPPGGCTPIGVTASGEIVFPFTCKALLERVRGPIENPKAVARDEKPVQPENEKVETPAAAVSIQADAPAQNEPVIQPVETVPLPKPRTGKWRRPKAEPPEEAATAGRVGRRHQQALSRATHQRPS